MLRHVLLAAVVVLLGLVVAAFFLTSDPRASAGPGDEQGRFRVVAGQSSYVLYDSVSGVSWVMFPDGKDKRFTWLPIKRLNTAAEIEAWRLGRDGQ